MPNARGGSPDPPSHGEGAAEARCRSSYTDSVLRVQCQPPRRAEPRPCSTESPSGRSPAIPSSPCRRRRGSRLSPPVTPARLGRHACPLGDHSPEDVIHIGQVGFDGVHGDWGGHSGTQAVLVVIGKPGRQRRIPQHVPTANAHVRCSLVAGFPGTGRQRTGAPETRPPRMVRNYFRKSSIIW